MAVASDMLAAVPRKATDDARVCGELDTKTTWGDNDCNGEYSKEVWESWAIVNIMRGFASLKATTRNKESNNKNPSLYTIFKRENIALNFSLFFSFCMFQNF